MLAGCSTGGVAARAAADGARRPHVRGVGPDRRLEDDDVPHVGVAEPVAHALDDHALADLEPEERVNISANPVRGPELVINYVSRPLRITVYDILGVPVRTFTPAEIGEVLTLWSLDNDAGRPVANGAFVLVVEFESDRVLRKLLVLRP